MSEISKYKNVFNEPATKEDLVHIFKIMDEENDDRIILYDFAEYVEYLGLHFSNNQLIKVHDHIASSVTGGKYITSESWTKGIDIAHQQPSTKKLYQAFLSGQQYDPQPDREEIDMEDIRVALNETKAPWMFRVECMESLSRQITVSSMDNDTFNTLFDQYHISLTMQAKDRRSNVRVSRVACECFAKIIVRWKDEFAKYSQTTIECMIDLMQEQSNLVHDSAINVLVVLLKNVHDDKQCQIMHILGREATTSKFVNLQKDCFNLLLLYVKQQPRALKSRKEFWSKLLDYTKKGVNDTADVRNSALSLLAQIERERPKLVKGIVENMHSDLSEQFEGGYKLSPKASVHFGDEEEPHEQQQSNLAADSTKRRKKKKKSKDGKSSDASKKSKKKKKKHSKAKREHDRAAKKRHEQPLKTQPVTVKLPTADNRVSVLSKWIMDSTTSPVSTDSMAMECAFGAGCQLNDDTPVRSRKKHTEASRHGLDREQIDIKLKRKLKVRLERKRMERKRFREMDAEQRVAAEQERARQSFLLRERRRNVCYLMAGHNQ